MSEEKAKQGRARIVASTAPVEMRDVQIVIEAASEKLEIKKQIFADLATKTGPDANSRHKYLGAPDQRNCAATTGSPERVIGLHFFNPVSRMKLVEVVVGKQTAPATRQNARSPSRVRSENSRWSFRTARAFSSIACSFRICSTQRSFSRAA